VGAEGNGRARLGSSGDPWRDAPTSELGDPVLPRWFVLTAIAAVVAAIGVGIAAFVLPARSTVPEAARRPPPSAAWTTSVGAVEAGGSPPDPYDAPCALLDGLRLAGTAGDQAQLRRGLAALCTTPLPAATRDGLEAFAGAGGVVRFATFEATGVDSTASRRGDEPMILVNARFQRTDPRWIAPLVAHDVVIRAGDPATAAAALAARRAELDVCASLLDDEAFSRACADAAAVVSTDDPLAALRDAGYR
jgi:hypothetical protein